MAGIVFFALVATPIIEIILFIQAGKIIGLWPTVGCVIVTAIIGTILLRHQGFSVLRSVQASVDAGRAPVTEVFHGFCIVLGGALLLTPGFLTDAIGLALLTPPVRRFLARVLAGYAAKRGDIRVTTTAHPPPGGFSPGATRSGAQPGDIIEGEYEEVADADDETPRGSAGDKPPRSSSPWKPRQP